MRSSTKQKLLTLLLVLSIGLFPIHILAREYTPAEHDLIAYINRRVQEIIAQTRLLLAEQEHALRATIPDRTAPLISITNATATPRALTVTWLTNKPTKSRFAYGLGPDLLPVGTTTRFVVNDNLMLQHSVSVLGLTAHTTYYYTIEATDAIGNTAKTNFAELHVPNPQNFAAPTIRQVAAQPATNSAQITWTTDTDTTSRVYFSQLYPLVLTGSATSRISSSTPVKFHTILLTELIASSTYYYAVESVDAYGFQTTSGDFRFTTLRQ